MFCFLFWRSLKNDLLSFASDLFFVPRRDLDDCLIMTINHKIIAPFSFTSFKLKTPRAPAEQKFH